jgi:MFS family permease
MPPGESSEPRTYAALLTDSRFAVVVLVSAAGTIGSVLPAALPAIAAGLGVSDGTVGQLVTAYKLPSVLIVPVAAAIADIYGRRTVLLPSLAVFGIAGSLMVALPSFPLLLAFAICLGVGGAAIYPLSVTLLGDFFSGERNAAGQGIRVGAIGVGTVVVPAAAGSLAGIRWNYPFLLFLVVLPIAAVVHVALPEPLDRSVSRERLRSIVAGYFVAVREDLAAPSLAVLVSGGFVRGFTRYALLTFAPLFAVSHLGASFVVAGLLLSVRGVVLILVAPFAGALVGRFARKWLLVGSLSVSGLALAILPFVQDVVWLGALIGLHTLGDATFDPVNKGTVTAMARRERRAGIVNTLYLLKRVGQAAAPLGFGLLLSATNYQTLFLAAGVVVGTYVLAFAAVFRFEPAAE